MKLRVIHGDITRQRVDVIVNAANNELLGGGGVDGAIHLAAGPELLDECKTLGGCATGEAKITKGYKLMARHVIHTVGPVWQGGTQNEDGLLSQCYLNSLILAEKHLLPTLAFPSISTGAFGFPMERAAKIAVSTIKSYLKKSSHFEKVLLVCFDKNSYIIHTNQLKL